MVTHVLLHGFAGTPAAWTEVASHLRGPVVTPALPGHGGSLRLTSRDFAGYVTWLGELVAAVDGPVHLAGYSAGGRIVAGALAAGVQCAAATIVSSSFGGLSPAERAERARRDADWSRLLREHGMEAFAIAWERQPIFASQAKLPNLVRDAQRAERLRLDPAALADAMDALSAARMPDLREAMRAVARPWQLVVGALDAKYVEIARESGAVRTATLASCGHNPLLEAPAPLATAINEFLQWAGLGPSH